MTVGPTVMPMRRGVDAVLRERGLEDAAALLDERAVGLLAAAPLQERGRRQLPVAVAPGASSPRSITI